MQGVPDPHLCVYLLWRSLLSRIFYGLKRYKEEDAKYISCLAAEVWHYWRNVSSNQDLFAVMHKRCCNLTNINCKVVSADTEKRVILTMMRMAKEDDYAADILSLAEIYPNHYVAPSRTELKRLEKETNRYANYIIGTYMRMAIWKEHFSLPLSILEVFLCCQEGIINFGLHDVPGIWTIYGDLKKLPVICYKKYCCRHCFSKKFKMKLCKNCRCVYFCKDNSRCEERSKADVRLGHTQEECDLFKTRATCVIQKRNEDQTL